MSSRASSDALRARRKGNRKMSDDGQMVEELDEDACIAKSDDAWDASGRNGMTVLLNNGVPRKRVDALKEELRPLRAQLLAARADTSDGSAQRQAPIAQQILDAIKAAKQPQLAVTKDPAPAGSAAPADRPVAAAEVRLPAVGPTVGNALEYALAYAQLGLPVLPVDTKTKRPLGGNGIEHANTDPDVIRGWFKRWPDGGIGIHLAPARLGAIDLDPRNGCMKTPEDYPATLTARTGGGGYHLIYRVPAGVVLPSKLGPGIDIKHKGYIIVEPSLHPSGGVYAWIEFDPIAAALVGLPDIADFPLHLIEKPAAPAASGIVDGQIPKGGRNDTMNRLAFYMKKTGHSDAVVLEALRAANADCKPPLADSELQALARGKRKIEADTATLKADAGALLERAKPDHLHVTRTVIEETGAENLIYTQGTCWMWDAGGVWRLVDDRTIKQRIHAVLEAKYAGKYQVTSNIVNSVFDLLKTECLNEELRFDALALNVINVLSGELHLVGGAWELRPHVRENYRSTQLPVAYDALAGAPLFTKFLAEIFEGDPDAEQKKAVILEALGYSLLPDCRFERFLLLVGAGANGKSVLLAVLAALVGTLQVSAVQPSQFDNRFQRAHLRGKLVNIITEIAEGGEIADAELKAIVSGEIITGEHKHRDPFEFRPIATCWFATNHMPHTRDFSDALFRRAIIVPFNRRFDGQGNDPNLKDKLQGERPGILNLALEGLARLIRQGRFTVTASGEAAKLDWRLQADQVAQFVEERCELDPAHVTPSARLYSAFGTWAQDSGIVRKVNHKNFTQRIQRLGIEAGKSTHGARMLFGVRLREEHDGPF
jgi:P4 family phage/plasmid primase-like protien